MARQPRDLSRKLDIHGLGRGSEGKRTALTERRRALSDQGQPAISASIIRPGRWLVVLWRAREILLRGFHLVQPFFVLQGDGEPLQVPVRWTVALHKAGRPITLASQVRLVRSNQPRGRRDIFDQLETSLPAYRAVMTNPLMRLWTTPSPNRLRIASVALAVASSSVGGFLASISVRSGVP